MCALTLDCQVNQMFAPSVSVVGGAPINTGILPIAVCNRQLRFQAVVSLYLTDAQPVIAHVQSIAVVHPLNIYGIIADYGAVDGYGLSAANGYIFTLKLESRWLCGQIDRFGFK